VCAARAPIRARSLGCVCRGRMEARQHQWLQGRELSTCSRKQAGSSQPCDPFSSVCLNSLEMMITFYPFARTRYFAPCAARSRRASYASLKSGTKQGSQDELCCTAHRGLLRPQQSTAKERSARLNNRTKKETLMSAIWSNAALP
jgi:hypothetical protein